MSTTTPDFAPATRPFGDIAPLELKNNASKGDSKILQQKYHYITPKIPHHPSDIHITPVTFTTVH
jgi:hypothetical protein